MPHDIQCVGREKKEAASIAVCLQRKPLKHTDKFLEMEAVNYSRILFFAERSRVFGTQLQLKAKDECVHNYNASCTS
jgi:hypothetical protein